MKRRFWRLAQRRRVPRPTAAKPRAKSRKAPGSGTAASVFTEAQLRRAAAEARLTALKNADPDSLPSVRESLLVRDLKARYADLDRKVAQIAERFGPQWPELESTRAELERLDGRLAQETDQIVLRVLRAAEAEYLEAREEERALTRLLEDKKGQAQRLNRQSVEYVSLAAEVV